MSINPNMANREVCDLDFCNYTTGVPFLHVDYANTSALGLTGTTVYARGGQGAPRRIAFDGEKEGTIKFETQIQPFKLYSLITGATVGASGTLLEREVVTCATAGKLNIKYNPTATSINVFVSTDTNLDDVYVGTWASVAATEPATGYDITFTAGGEESKTITSGASYIVYYKRSVVTGVKVLSIKDTTFPKDFAAYGYTFYKAEDGNEPEYRWLAYKCHPQNNIEINFANSGDPTTLTVTCDILADSDGNMLDMVLIEE